MKFRNPLLGLAILMMASATVHAHTQAKTASLKKNSSLHSNSIPPVSAAPKMKSYREWKRDIVQDVQSKITGCKVQIESRKQQNRVAAVGNDPNLKYLNKEAEGNLSHDVSLEKLERDLRREEYELDIAQDLTVTDYFVGYLIKAQNKKAAFQEAAGKLTPDEVAELMTAYANSVFGTHTADLPQSATDVPKDLVK